MTKQPQKILIVDDKPRNLYALAQVLKESGAEIIKAENGNDALTATLHHDFALAMFDVQMPEMDGYELAELMRGEERTKRIPIIFLSAVYSDEYHIFKGYRSGAVDFITKPYNPAVLMSKVHVFLQLDSQKRELVEKLEIERSKIYLENIFATLSDAVLVVSQGGTIQTVNRSAQSLLGYNENEMIGMPVDTVIHGTDREGRSTSPSPSPWDGKRISVFKRAPFENREETLWTKAGEKIPVLLSLSFFGGKDGGSPGAVFVATDIRERRKEEENRIHMEKMRALGTVTAGVAHELNNPMMGIMGFAEYCRHHTRKEDKRYGILCDIEKETRRCIDIVQNLLTFSRTGSESEPIYQNIGLEMVMDRVLKLLAYRIEREKVTITRHYPDAPLEVRIQSERMQQVFLNLMVNALDALKGRDQPEIRIEIGTGDDWAQVIVADNGEGIPMEMQKRVFDPFFTTKPPGSGTGLGLSTAMAIVNAHGGKILCESERSAGARFRVMLPIHGAAL